MALGPITPPSAQPPPTRDVGAAQRAFFQAAVGQAQAPAAPVQPQASAAAQADAPEDTARSYRPGKLLDIKV